MQHRPDTLEHKRMLITGANGGLGLATTIGALEDGAHVVLACRTEGKARAAAAAAVASAGVTADQAEAAGGFDMLDPDSIEQAVAALPPQPFDVVFLQAGGWVFTDEVQTVQPGGVVVERTVAKNVIGAHATLRALLDTGRVVEGARVVIIGGEGARGVPGGIAKPSFTGVQDFERYLAGDWTGRDAYVAVDALGVAKFCAGLWALQLASRRDDLEVLWFTPGLIAGTGGTQGMPAFKEFLFQRIAFPLLVWLGKAQWPEAAARKCLDCLSGRIGESGALLGAPEGTALGELTDQLPMQPLFSDVDLQRVLWRTCESAAGAMPVAPPAHTIAL